MQTPTPLYQLLQGRKHTLNSWLNLPVRMRLSAISAKHHKNRARQLVVFSHDHIADDINLDGVYEGDYLKTLFSWLQKEGVNLTDATALDIGANIGNHAVYFSDYFKEIHAFEPNPRTYKVLSLNAELCPNIVTHNYGLSNKEHTAVLHINPENIGYSSISKALHIDKHTEKKEISLKTLDKALPKLAQVKFIKIDVEGHEKEALEGAKQTIQTHKPIVLFEQHTGDFDNETSPSIQLLKKMGYRRFVTINRSPKSDATLSSKLKAAFQRLLNGSSLIVQEADHFAPDFYPFIVALPEWFPKSR